MRVLAPRQGALAAPGSVSETLDTRGILPPPPAPPLSLLTPAARLRHLQAAPRSRQALRVRAVASAEPAAASASQVSAMRFVAQELAMRAPPAARRPPARRPPPTRPPPLPPRPPARPPTRRCSSARSAATRSSARPCG
jgi:hypothetical protein